MLQWRRLICFVIKIQQILEPVCVNIYRSDSYYIQIISLHTADFFSILKCTKQYFSLSNMNAHARTHARTHLYVQTHIHKHSNTYALAYMLMHTFTFTRIQTHTHTQTQTHTHTHSKIKRREYLLGQECPSLKLKTFIFKLAHLFWPKIPENRKSFHLLEQKKN